MPDLSQLNHGHSAEYLRVVTAQMIAQAPESQQPAQRDWLDRIPNVLTRTLYQFASFLESQGRDNSQRLNALRKHFDEMSPSSRENNAQLLHFMLSVLLPLAEEYPPDKYRTRAK